jgi:hypothetical protein
MPKRKQTPDDAVSQERLLEEISHAAFFDPLDLFNEDGTLKDLRDVPEGARRAIAQFKVAEFSDRDLGRKGVMKEVKLVSKGSALTLAERHLKSPGGDGPRSSGAGGDGPRSSGAGGDSGADGDCARLDLARLTDEELAQLQAILDKAAV